MKFNTQIKTIFRIVNILLFCATNLIASEIIETTEPVEDLNLKVLKHLNYFTNDKVKSVNKTQGFNYKYKPFILSPYRFDIYVGKFTKKSNDSIIRIETPRNGETRVYRNMLEQAMFPEKEWNVPPTPIQSKSHFTYQLTNLLSPSLGIIYSGYKSPFYTKDEMAVRSVLYILIDLAIVTTVALYAQNTKKSKSLEDKLLLRPGPDDLNLLNGKNTGILIGLLAIPRIYRSMDGYFETATQNRFAELGYTINF